MINFIVVKPPIRGTRTDKKLRSENFHEFSFKREVQATKLKCELQNLMGI